jgi:hypothetical protein
LSEHSASGLFQKKGHTVARGFEYLVCLSQAGKVTFVNNQWQGHATGNQDIMEVRELMYDTCPDLSEFLQKAGREGWELVAAYAVALPNAVQEKLFLKRLR